MWWKNRQRARLPQAQSKRWKQLNPSTYQLVEYEAQINKLIIIKINRIWCIQSKSNRNPIDLLNRNPQRISSFFPGSARISTVFWCCVIFASESKSISHKTRKQGAVPVRFLWLLSYDRPLWMLLLLLPSSFTATFVLLYITFVDRCRIAILYCFVVTIVIVDTVNVFVVLPQERIHLE